MIRGGPIALQDVLDEQRQFVSGQKTYRYLGDVKFYDFAAGFGYARLQDGYDIPPDVPYELRIDRVEIKPEKDGSVPRLRPGTIDNFLVFQHNSSGKFV